MILILAIACTPEPEEAADSLPFDPAGPEAAPDPSTWGPFPVGVSTVYLVDPDRIEDDGEPREIPVEIWYPAAEADGELKVYPLAEIVPQRRLDADGISAAELPEIISNSYKDAAPDDVHGPYPLVVFSHGNGGIRVQSMFFTEVLASHGYVVASPDHVGNTLGDFLLPGYDQDASTMQAFIDRPLDVDLVVSALSDDSPAPVDMERMGVSGHSLGTWTALRVAALDPRFSAVVAQAPVDTAYALVGTGTDPDQLDATVLLQAGDQDDTLDYEDNAVLGYERLAPPAFLATYFGAGHFTFSDLCVFDLGPVEDMIYDSVGDALDDGCGPDNVSPDVASPLIRLHAIGVLNAVLRGSPGSRELVDEAEDPAFELRGAW